MYTLKELTDRFTRQSKNILGDNLTGIYLHGSAVMGCFNEKKSDIDLLVVVKNDIPTDLKKQYLAMIYELNKEAPEKGIEMSVVKESVCDPFVYPTPFELHFSAGHLDWYRSNPDGYAEKMNGTDKDLAAHFTIIFHRGKTLYGKEIPQVFAQVSRENYMDSIRSDIENAKKDITEDPTYITLNLCRVLAYKKDGLILSKQEGGEWAQKFLCSEEYKALISAALDEYKTGRAMTFDPAKAQSFAEYILGMINE